jgi:tetratricopeptide (TPR) repeat protein
MTTISGCGGAQSMHHEFSVQAHNEATDIIYSENPTEEQTSNLIELAHVAHWHWMKRDDKTKQNMSVSLWLLSRAYSANGLGMQALKYGEASLEVIRDENLLPSFYGYSHEAIARAHQQLGNTREALSYLTKAQKIAETVPNVQAQEYLASQINRIQL